MLSNLEYKPIESGPVLVPEPEDSAAKRILKAAGIDSVEMNIDNDQVISNVAHNIRLGFEQVKPHNAQKTRVCIVGGGWSLNETEDELRELYWSGAKLVAVNGSAQWLIDKGMKPSALVILDGQERNSKFLDLPKAPDDMKVFLASQCHPSLFDAAGRFDTRIWHCWGTNSEEEKALLDKYYNKKWMAVPGTTCVGFRAVCLMRVLGYIYFDLFGIDSCTKIDTGQHHAYPQPENDNESVAEVNCGGKVFYCSGWQYVQAAYFTDMVKMYGDDFFINSHGDGLITQMIRTGSPVKNTT